ncbi:ArsR/SmtB family transcription factor [Marinitoga lauensis]|uniref:ArsR/SmtB family transcription factor n=1 Tax=Marinitoga lauensis TaxID=2201189 RepID=UPI0010136B72|nr:metalloregulator ArsR/SmtB family transcription factor [Marinitoga lauensis]
MNKFIELLKAFSDETRLRIINILNQGEYCNCDIEDVLEISQANTSKHLKKLALLDIVKSRKESYWTYYSLNEEILKNHEFIFELLKEIKEVEPFKSDLKKLKIHEQLPKKCHIKKG